MKRIYFSILVTALVSLFLLGKLADHLFDSNATDAEHADYLLESHLLKQVSEQLSLVGTQELTSHLEHWSEKLDIGFSLVPRSSLSLSTSLSSALESERGLLVDSTEQLQVIRAIENHPQYLLVYNAAIDLDHSKENHSDLEIGLTLLFYFGFCFILLLWTLPLTRRLANLNRFAQDFGSGDLAQRVNINRFSYLQQLELSFNRMASQIEELITENKLLAGSISHDLRTPLSCLRFGIDAALETNEVDKKNYYLSRMDDDLTRTEVMLEAFLDYASLERKRFELNRTDVNIMQLIESVINSCQLIAKQQNIMLEQTHSTLIQGTMLQVDPQWIERAICNLISNAIQHGQSRVLVSCESNATDIIISIEDDGVGIAAEDMQKIFKAFVKLDPSRSRRENFGLGLAIVTRVLSWHNGSVSVERSKILSGAKFIIRLPRN